MNKKIASTFILILALASFTPSSFAAFDAYKIVGSAGSFIEKTVFGFDDPSPYLYMRLPANGQAFTGSFWRDPDAAIFYMSTTGSAPDRDRWITLADWPTVKKQVNGKSTQITFIPMGTPVSDPRASRSHPNPWR